VLKALVDVGVEGEDVAIGLWEGEGVARGLVQEGQLARRPEARPPVLFYCTSK
jgi:hypothetical protein